MKRLAESSKKIVCPNCGHHNHSDVKKCSKCGHPRGKGKWRPVASEMLSLTDKQLRKIIREALSLSESKMLPIIVNPYEDLETMNRVANYALTNDIQGALADEMVNYENLHMDLSLIHI